MVLEVIPEVEERLIGSKKVKSWLIYCCKKPHVDLWEYFNGVEDRLWKYSEWVEDEFWKLTLKVEEWLIDLIEAIYWLYHCWKKFYLDLLKYFHWVVNGFESIPKGLNIGFGTHPRG